MSSPSSPADKIRLITERLKAGEPVRRTVPGLGRLHIDRQIPFLCVHRTPGKHSDKGTARLITGEAAHLSLTNPSPKRTAMRDLITATVDTLSEIFGAFLICEVWTSPPDLDADINKRQAPAFRIHTPRNLAITSTVEMLQAHLKKVRVQHRPATVEVVHGKSAMPPGLPPLLTAAQARSAHCHIIGLEVAPIFRSVEGDALYPLTLRALRRGVSKALRRTFHHFCRTHTSHTPPSYLALGRRRLAKAVWDVDEQLAAIGDSFDFLLQVTPINIESSWSTFRRSKFQRIPPFLYRPRPIDPALVKRRLFKIPIERIDDPTLEQLFREKQEELDCQLTMLSNRDTKRFIYGSLQLYGGIDQRLLGEAKRILSRVPPRARETSRGGNLSAADFAKLAREEVDRYRAAGDGFTTKVEVREDIYSGLMVSKGNLLIGRETQIPRHRAEALLNHEIGTHALTYHNGGAQPFRQLQVGLAGYDELQEGLAVLSEFLVGGLSGSRLRLLAARVLAAHSLVDGATFPEVFRLLHQTHGLTQRSAFTVAMRIFRGGGLTKDAVYLRGYLQVLEHIRNGGELDSLFIGKVAAHHLPLIRELSHRRILRPMRHRPWFLDREECRARLQSLRDGADPLQLVTTRPRKRQRP